VYSASDPDQIRLLFSGLVFEEVRDINWESVKIYGISNDFISTIFITGNRSIHQFEHISSINLHLLTPTIKNPRLQFRESKQVMCREGGKWDIRVSNDEIVEYGLLSCEGEMFSLFDTIEFTFRIPPFHSLEVSLVYDLIGYFGEEGIIMKDLKKNSLSAYKRQADNTLIYRLGSHEFTGYEEVYYKVHGIYSIKSTKYCVMHSIYQQIGFSESSYYLRLDFVYVAPSGTINILQSYSRSIIIPPQNLDDDFSVYFTDNLLYTVVMSAQSKSYFEFYPPKNFEDLPIICHENRDLPYLLWTCTACSSGYTARCTSCWMTYTLDEGKCIQCDSIGKILLPEMKCGCPALCSNCEGKIDPMKPIDYSNVRCTQCREDAYINESGLCEKNCDGTDLYKRAGLDCGLCSLDSGNTCLKCEDYTGECLTCIQGLVLENGKCVESQKSSSNNDKQQEKSLGVSSTMIMAAISSLVLCMLLMIWGGMRTFRKRDSSDNRRRSSSTSTNSVSLLSAECGNNTTKVEKNSASISLSKSRSDILPSMLEGYEVTQSKSNLYNSNSVPFVEGFENTANSKDILKVILEEISVLSNSEILAGRIIDDSPSSTMHKKKINSDSTESLSSKQNSSNIDEFEAHLAMFDEADEYYNECFALEGEERREPVLSLNYPMITELPDTSYSLIDSEK